MSSRDSQEFGSPTRNLGWPAAATLITAILGAALTTVAWAIVPDADVAEARASDFVSTREIGEVKARLAAIEETNRQMRVELRAEIKDVRDLLRQLLKQQ